MKNSIIVILITLISLFGIMNCVSPNKGKALSHSGELKTISGFSILSNSPKCFNYFLFLESNEDDFGVFLKNKSFQTKVDTIYFDDSTYVLNIDTFPKSLHKIAYRLNAAPISYEFKRNLSHNKCNVELKYHKNIKVRINGIEVDDGLNILNDAHYTWKRYSTYYQNKKYILAVGSVGRTLTVTEQ